MLAANYDRDVATLHSPTTSWPLRIRYVKSYGSEELAVVYHTCVRRTDAIMKQNDGEYAIDDEQNER
jgi:hypothetical protein